MSTVQIVISGRNELGPTVSSVVKELDAVGHASETAKEKGTSFFSGMLQMAGGFLTAGVVTGIAGQLSGMFTEGITGAREAAGVLAQTNAVIASTGGIAGVSAKDVLDLSGALSDASGKSLFSGEQVASAENLSLTFTAIGKDVMPMVTQANIDMAQSLGKTPEAMAQLTGKALSTAGGITALRKIGVQFSDDQVKLVTHLFETGRAADAQKIILKELGTEFGGSAEAASKAAGGWHQFKAQLDDTVKGIVGNVLPSFDKIGSVLAGPQVQGAIQGLADGLSNGLGTAIDWLTGTALPALSSGWQMLQGPLQRVTQFLTPIISGFVDFQVSISPLFTIISGLTSSWSDMVATWQETGSIAEVVDVFIEAIDGMGPAGDIISTFLAIGRDLVPVVGAIGSALWNGDTAAAVTAFQQGMAGIGAQVGFLATELGDWLVGIASTIATNVMAWGSAFVGWLGPHIPGILAALGGLAASVGSWILAQAAALGSQLLTWGQGFVDWIAPYVGPALQALGAFGLSVGQWILEQAPLWGAQLLAWGQGFIDWIAPMISPALAALGAFVTGIGSWILAQLPVIGAQLLAWGQAFIDWVAPMIPPALAALGTLISGIGAWVVAQVPVIAAQLLAWGQGFVAWVQPMIPPALAALGGLASGLLGWIGQQAAPILASLGAWATSFVAWIGPATVKFLAEWPGMLNQFLDWIGSAVGPLLLKLGEWALQFVAWIAPMIPGFVVGLGAVAVALLAFVGETVVTLAGKLLEWAGAFVDWIGSSVVPKLGPALGAITGAIGSWITGTALPWLGTEAATLGTAIIAGIKSGISAGVGALTGAITAAAHGALNAAKAALGIHSPSKVFADEVGAPIVQGMQLGVLRTMPQLLAAMRSSTDSLIQEMVSFVDQGDNGPLTKAGADAINAFVAGMQHGPASGAADAIRSILKTGDFTGDIGRTLGVAEDSSFVDYLLKARNDATSLKNILDLLQSGGFHGGILGLNEDDPFIEALLKASSTVSDLAPKLPDLAGGMTKIATAAGAATRTTNDLLDHIKVLGDKSIGDKMGFKGGSDDPFSFLNKNGGLGASADYAKQAGSGAGMSFGDGWQAGIEQIKPQQQAVIKGSLDLLQPVVFDPWKVMTNDYMSGAGFGFAGSVATGIGSAGGDIAQSASRVGGAAGSALSSGLQGSVGGAIGAIGSVQAALNDLKDKTVTITVNTVHTGDSSNPTGLKLPGFASGVRGFTGGLALVGENGPELVDFRRGDVYTARETRQMAQSTGSAGSRGGPSYTFDFSGANFAGSNVTPEHVQAIVTTAIAASEQRQASRTTREAASYGASF